MNGDPWPFPGDPPIERLKWVARSYRAHLAQHDPDAVARIDQRMTGWGQGWITADPSVIDLDEWIPATRAAELLCVTVGQVAALRRRGRLPGRDLAGGGRLWEYRTRDVLALTDTRRRRGRESIDEHQEAARQAGT